MKSMRSERWAVVGVLVVIVLLGVPVSAFAVSLRGGGVQTTLVEGFVQAKTIHVKLDQRCPDCRPLTGTISVHVGETFFDFTVTDGFLEAGSGSGFLSGTVTIAVGAPPAVICLQGYFEGSISNGGPGVGSFSASFPSCQVTVLDVLLDHGNIQYSP